MKNLLNQGKHKILPKAGPALAPFWGHSPSPSPSLQHSGSVTLKDEFRKEASPHLHQLHHVGVVQLLEDGNLLVDLLDGPSGLQAALGSSLGPAGRRAA